ncbi:DNA polymerase III delta prime subunit [Amycolatopsis magusensis]|uniref:DNA polymerase III delta prime subunit n=1 Tax=Amycolatopsis magusensis TaxID=882444 RepID=A0ABS4PRV7_9PSEU|nr:MoxR family ATPase [Amycolatopsis magusensis]MBP2181599.1 DNA polymerase III delta prime subunit [Amycolatopsis magusensis]
MSLNEQDATATLGRRAAQFEPPDWWIYRSTGRPIHDIELVSLLPPPPPWRSYDGGPLPEHDVPPPDDGEAERRLGAAFTFSEQEVDLDELNMVNAGIVLRRPLLVTGNPGTGKSSLAYRIARELGLGRVLRWAITGHTTLGAGLYGYDAIGRVQAAATSQAQLGDVAEEPPPIGDFVRLGPLGTAFLPTRLPRVLLIDELDKSESDLLSIFEDGEFPVDELARVRNRQPEVTVHTADPQRTAVVRDGRVACNAFPIVVMTSNGEREFPPAFLRRCLQLKKSRTRTTSNSPRSSPATWSTITVTTATASSASSPNGARPRAVCPRTACSTRSTWPPPVRTSRSARRGRGWWKRSGNGWRCGDVGRLPGVPGPRSAPPAELNVDAVRPKGARQRQGPADLSWTELGDVVWLAAAMTPAATATEKSPRKNRNRFSTAAKSRPGKRSQSRATPVVATTGTSTPSSRGSPGVGLHRARHGRRRKARAVRGRCGHHRA